MITGRQTVKTSNGGTIEIYENDRFVGNLDYTAISPVGYINFIPKRGKPGLMEVDIRWWLSTSLDYRKREVENLIKDCLDFRLCPCPMTI